MSDNILFEMQSEIMKRLPVKSLLQFRSVSKSWKSLIDSSHFIAHYHTQMQHILVTYDDNPYASFVDDHTFPHQGVSPTVPLLVYMLRSSRIIGSSHGLLCMHGVYSQNRTNMALLLNLSIRRAIPVVVPNVDISGMYDTAIGFGVCCETIDPKIVKITYVKSESDVETITSIPWQVEVFTLSTGVWRSPYSSNLPRKSIHFGYHRVVADGFLYWLATDRITTYGGFSSYNLIISFDLTSEEFKEVKLPDGVAHDSVSNLSMFKLRESLVVVQHGVVEAGNPVIVLWMMEGGVEKSFVKLFSVNDSTLGDACVRGFRKTGELLIEIYEDYIPVQLVAYDPYSKRTDYLELEGACTFFVFPYVETLLLLDQPNLEVYDEMETIRFLDDLVS